MDVSDKIRRLRIHKSMTQKELSAAIGVSVVSLQCWEGGTKKPSASAIVALANFFNVSADYLLGVTPNKDIDVMLMSQEEKRLLEDYRILDRHGKDALLAICSVEKSRVLLTSQTRKLQTGSVKSKSEPRRYIPRYATPSAAGSSIPLDGDDFEMILVDDSIPESADFAVEIQGDSMLPYIKNGDTVYVTRDAELSIGDVGIFCVDGAMYCKQYYIDDEKNLTLVSANQCLKNTNVYVSADSGSDVICYGKVLLGFRVSLPDYFTTQ